MKKYLKILISGIVALIALGGFATIAFAIDAITPFVTFTPNPLFVQGNFLPADEATGIVEVRNSGTSPQVVITEAVHVSDPDNLSSQLHLLITKIGGVALYDGSFKTFLTGGEKVLSGLPGSSSETYTFIVTFNNTNDNSYQGKTLDFNLCVGFQGGQTRCGDTIIGDEEDTGGGDNNDGGGTILGSGGSSSGGGGARHLIIFNEKSTDVSTTATITWETNLLSTSQVVYGLASGGSYTLDLNNLPNFGYPLGTAEDSSKVINHSMTLTGLTPGATYVYRVVSRASPPTISYEHEFTVPISSQTGNIITSGPLGISGLGSTGTAGEGSVLGASSDSSADGNGEVAGAFSEGNLASVFSSGWSDLISRCSLVALLILLIIYLIWRFALRPGYERKGLPEEKIKQKFYTFFGLSSALAIVVAFLLDQTCPIPIFLIALLLSLGLFSYYRYFR